MECIKLNINFSFPDTIGKEIFYKTIKNLRLEFPKKLKIYEILTFYGIPAFYEIPTIKGEEIMEKKLVSLPYLYLEYKNFNVFVLDELEDKIITYLNMAREYSKNSNCIRRHYGCVIVNKYDKLISSGYAASPNYRMSCKDEGICLRDKLNIPRGQNYEICKSVHAEMNAIINASIDDMRDSILFLSGEEPDGTLIDSPIPCSICKRLIINSGIKYVIVHKKTESNVIEDFEIYSVNDF